MARTPGQAARRDPDWEGVRLHVVSGKGGTGKTTLAAALALALAADGGRVLLIEVEGRQGIAELFGIAALPYEERRIASVSRSQLGLPAGEVPAGGARGGEVLALAIDTEQALLEYLEMFYKLGRAGKALQKVGFVDFATTIAPGVRDVLLTGKACEAARRKGPDGRRRYDAVVMDAPPTGRITRFLNVNSEVAGLARIGPIHTQAQAVMRVLRSPETAVHLVTLLEEMPVQETVDGIAELREAKLPVGGVMVNMVRPPRWTGTTARRWRWPSARPGWGAARAGRRRSGRRWSRCSTRCWNRPGSTPSGSSWSANSAPTCSSYGSRRTNCRCWARAWTSVGCTGWRAN